MRKNLWGLHFSSPFLFLIPIAVLINYIGKLFADILQLPLWLDSIGTILASMLAGPIIGAAVGAVNNIVYGLTINPISFIYALTSVAIAITAGVLAYKGWSANIWKACILALLIAFTAAVISTPINILIRGGQTGNIWGEAVYNKLIDYHFPDHLSLFFNIFVIELPDKLSAVLISYAIIKILPDKILNLYR